MTITIRPDGTLEAIYSDTIRPLLAQGDSSIRRASHVEPNLHGEWEADMAPVCGPVLGPFLYREEALAAEVAWLETNHL